MEGFEVECENEVGARWGEEDEEKDNGKEGRCRMEVEAGAGLGAEGGGGEDIALAERRLWFIIARQWVSS